MAEVFIHPRLRRQLADMVPREGGPTQPSAIAAHRARQIIDRLAQGVRPPSCGRMSPRPDKRIKNSLKFDLGSGFRLICIRERSAIHVMFVGNHDRCDAWLNHHIRSTPLKVPLSTGIRHPSPPRDGDPEAGPPPSITEEEFPYTQVSQKLLRKIFCGICSPARPA